MKLSDTMALIECREPGRIVGDIWPDRKPDEWTGQDAWRMVDEALRVLTPLVTRTIVVVTPGNRAWFNSWFPTKRILPGLAGNMLTGHALTDVAKCKLFVQCAEEAADMCGSDTVYVDLESAVEGYLKGEITLDLPAVTACIRETFGKSRVNFMWYHPEVVPYYLERSVALLNAFLAAIKLGDSFAPGFGSGWNSLGSVTDRWSMDGRVGNHGMHEQLLVRPGSKYHTAASALKWLKTFPLADPYIFNFPAAQCVPVAKDFAAAAAQQQETETMPATTIARKFVQPIDFGPLTGSLVSRAFRITDAIPLDSVPPTVTTVPLMSGVPGAPLRDPEVLTGPLARRALGHGNGRTVSYEGKRWLEVMTRFYNTDVANQPITSSIKMLNVRQPLRSEDAFNPLIHLNIGEILTSHDTAFEAEYGDDERRILSTEDIPPTWMVAPGVNEFVAIYVPIPDEVASGELLAIGFKCGR